MALPTPIQLRTAAEIRLRGITLRGALIHVPDDQLRVISSADDEEVLTIETPESQLARTEVTVINGVPTSRLVTIKD